MQKGLNARQQFVKRVFDLFFSIIGLIFLFIPICLLILISSISTKKIGVFSQKRIGKHAKLFTMYKIRTMVGNDDESSITLFDDKRVTSFGKFLRIYKLDELPQLYNVLIGDMSFVGPRPDVSGYADNLKGINKIILSVKPGITGPATLKFKNEEQLLLNQSDPKKYNDEIIWVEKVKINRQYIEKWTLLYDITYILKTIFN